MNTLVEVVNKIIRDNPGKVEQARKRSQLVGWFVGQIMKATTAVYTEADVRLTLSRRGLRE